MPLSRELKKLKTASLAVLLVITLSACNTSPKIEETMPQNEIITPEFKMEEYFNGPVKAWGVVQDRSGNVTRRFEVAMLGTWDGDKGKLEEHFDYYDGETQKRIWTVEKIAANQYQGTAADIIGVANGKTKGSAMLWAYVMKLKVGDDYYNVTFDDRMFLMRDGVLINRSYLKKFGVRVAELTIFMQKQPPVLEKAEDIGKKAANSTAPEVTKESK